MCFAGGGPRLGASLYRRRIYHAQKSPRAKAGARGFGTSARERHCGRILYLTLAMTSPSSSLTSMR